MAEMFDSTAARTAPMSKSTEDEIIQKAKELCRGSGKAWSPDDFQNDAWRDHAHKGRRCDGAASLSESSEGDARTEFKVLKGGHTGRVTET